MTTEAQNMLIIMGLSFSIGGLHLMIKSINAMRFSFNRRNDLGYIPASIAVGVLAFLASSAMLICGILLFGITAVAIITPQ